MISVIIPTKNEEKYLPLLLESVKSQNIRDLEIIVADANSTDKTREIAASNGCKIVEGGLPAKGRNNGAMASKGELLVFIDADVILPKDFLKKVLVEFDHRRLDVAGTLQEPLVSGFNLGNRIIYGTINNFMQISQKIKPHMQVCMFSKKKVHEEIGGFDESVVYAEDSHYAEKAEKVGKFGILRSSRVFISPRRFDNNFSFVLKCLYFNSLRIWGHEFYEGKTRMRYFT